MIAKPQTAGLRWSFTVYTEPIAKGRPRAVRQGNFVRMYTPGRTVTFEQAVSCAALDAVGNQRIDFPIRVDILAVFKRPKRLMRQKDPQGMLWKSTRPDADNVRKAVLDGMARILEDDALVVDGRTCKCYGAKGQEPLVKVFISSVAELPLDGRSEAQIVDMR